MRQTPPSLPRPLVAWTFAFLGGVGAGLLTPLPAPLPMAGLAWAGAAGWAVAAPGRRRLLALLLFAGAGWIRSDIALSPSHPHTLDRLMDRPAETFEVQGRILSDPVYTPEPPGDDDRYRFIFRIQRIHRLGQPQPATGDVQCRWRVSSDHPRPRYGDLWTFRGVVRDQGDHPLRRRTRLRWSLDVHDETASLVARRQGHPLIAWFLGGREACARVLGRGIEAFPRESAVLRALMLGYRSELPEDVEELFRFTGALHVFAVSGLHVGVFSLLLTGLFRSVGIASNRWVLLLIPLVAFYVVATGMKASTVRAGVMAIAYWSAWLLHRKPDAPSALALAALCIVAWRPAELIAPGFVLSFAVVAGLLVLYPALNTPLQRRLQPDPWRADPEPRLRRWTRRIASYLASLFALSVACWVVSLPLIAQYFNVVTPIGLLSNLVVVPGAFLLVFTGCLSLLTGAGCAVLAEIFNHANRVFVDLVLRVVSGLAEAPGGYRNVPSPGWAAAAAWYALLLGWRLLPGPYRGAGAAGLSALLLGWLVLAPLRLDLRITALDARGGVAVHADAGGRAHVLVDPGNRAAPLRRYLRRAGVTEIDTLVLSRGDRPTAGAVPGLLNSFAIRSIALCSHEGDPDLLGRILRLSAQHGAEVRILQSGERVRMPARSSWSVAAVRPTARGREAVLFRLERDGFSALLLTRTGPALEYALTQDVPDPRADVLIVSDRSLAGPLYSGWVDRVAPAVVVLSRKPVRAARDDLAAVLRPLQRKGRRVVFTDDAGGIRFSAASPRAGPGYRWQSLPFPE